MLDIKYIRENPDKVKKACQDKQVKCDIDRLLELDKKRRELLQESESLKAEQNKLGKDQQEKAREIKEEIKKIEPALKQTEQEFDKLMKQVPNLPLADVPVGEGEKDNKVLRQEGKKPEFSFKPKDYLEIAEKLDIIDIKRAAKVSGSRFGYLKGGAVLLEFALVQLAFENLIKKGFIPVIPPVMLNQKAMAGMGYLDRGTDEVYHLEKDNLYLVGTSEQSIGVMHMDEVFEEKELPKRYVGFSTCFRREAGAYGKDTKGILRVHQFDKVEMFVFCKPENSSKEHALLLAIEEELMKMLELPYQVIDICTGDLGDPAAEKWDIEAWFPSQNKYRETHSTSNCTDFQARRLNIRYKGKDGLKFVHTLNGTVFSQRPILAIIENYQQENGSILIPEALRKYMSEVKKIG
ncbi:MAG: serine--tRNA ligase [Parcubacteria group bacterium]|jgi:seryl-tRNA synthetase|nr:serine--tRNA ligase [Parcubacteria group bacterium]|tara:strand:+ start:8431 stop:9651 length:1221 start_codon:yes stop_codon:yes gene_type:complete